MIHLLVCAHLPVRLFSKIIGSDDLLEEALHLIGELAEKEKLSQRDEKIDA